MLWSFSRDALELLARCPGATREMLWRRLTGLLHLKSLQDRRRSWLNDLATASAADPRTASGPSPPDPVVLAVVARASQHRAVGPVELDGVDRAGRFLLEH